jgi:predicted GNAT family acetyltransferase
MSLEIHNDETARKFYAVVDGQEAVIEYAKMGDTYNLAHTYVPEELRGRGIAEELVRGALDRIREEGAKFLPSCPYIQGFLKRYPEYREGVAAAE